ncbi:endopeptidase La [Butyricicoccus pullicaecorum]|uniref:Lon protease n=1 Tax=Butyricicoccus pullicaecorum 1.2 TaxID=1203606 RepID=R8WA34_9FIRM|nr:endopeptidase La [Butyricicoccus pullicaecorum]EOQ39997.1 ATP-dependent protease La [Butyricicoccus pullicaecorum 1.2]SKA61942.1 ATP-dependent Lon protease [Butyricicoccus pullicaecorum DSM 23266]
MNVNDTNNQRMLPVLPLRGLTAFPDMLIHFDVGRAMSIKALEAAMKDGQWIFLTAQKDLKTDRPTADDLYEVGTICIIKQILRLPGDNIRVLVEGKDRARALHYQKSEDGGECLKAQVEVLYDILPLGGERREQALVRTVQNRFEEYAALAPRLSSDVALTVAAGGNAGYLADYIAQNIPIDFSVKQEVLEELNVNRRLTFLIRLLTEETEILRIEGDIQEQIKAAIDKNQKDYYLREQIKVIQSELGEQDVSAEAEEYREKIEKLSLPEESASKLRKETERLAKMSGSSAEAGVIRTYLDTVLELPWKTSTRPRHDLERAQKILDRDHYGLEKVKERILEFMAVKTLAPDLKGQVLCLVGPPGVGKTSIARSIAEAMNRKYTRMSLGGVRDEADIRGHRKTYIGAMPGRIIAALRQAGSRNPLILLDEIDKMGNDFRGDPASAMLEVLDTEQNNAFRDHYIEIPFDLSDVLFVTTANDLSTVPRPLLDRMEVIELSSYTAEEKLHIAHDHLLPKQIKKHGLKGTQLIVPEETLSAVISGYTREAGVRRLEQVIAKLCRKAAKKIADGSAKRVTIHPADLEAYLGAPKFKEDNVSKEDEVGIVNGLAWTSVGGEMLQVEVAAVPGTGKIEITGNLGKVMEESAKAAVTFVRSRAEMLRIDPNFYKNTDIHIHFPEAAIPKDGPSAGITMATAIISALTGAPVRHEVAMTGEVTLRGRVMPIGGLREKTMAAYRAGIRTIIIPKDNQVDLEEVEQVVKDHVQFVIAAHMDTVMETAIDFSRRPAVTTRRDETTQETQMPLSAPGSTRTTLRQ